MRRYSKPIKFKRLLAAPLDERELAPPRKPGVYIVGLREWSRAEDIPARDLVWFGRTDRGDAHLLFRVAGLLADAIGFSSEPGRGRGYFHGGGHKIWRAHMTGSPYPIRDPRDLYISWTSDECPACEENRLYDAYSQQNCPHILNKIRPPKCPRHLALTPRRSRCPRGK